MNILYAQSQTNAGSGIAAFLPIILIGLVFYLLILRPQTKQRKMHEKTLSELKKGDKIITRGGVFGTIINFQGKSNNKVLLEVGEGVRIYVLRTHISGLSTNPNTIDN